jgi:hypothetical protein
MELMDARLLPLKARALSGDPRAIREIADAYWFGRGAPCDPFKAGHYYGILADYPEKLEFVEYAYLHTILGDVAVLREAFSTAVEHYRTAYRLFHENYPKTEAEQRMEEIGFLECYQEAVLKLSLVM